MKRRGKRPPPMNRPTSPTSSSVAIGFGRVHNRAQSCPASAEGKSEGSHTMHISICRVECTLPDKQASGQGTRK